MKLVLPLAALAPLAAVGCIFTEGTKPGVALDLTAATQYNHRGMVQNDRGVLQPSMNVNAPPSFGGLLTFLAWANMDLADETGDAWFPDIAGGKFSEIDLKAQYSRGVGPVDLAGGVVTYVLPNGSEFPNGPRGTTTELFATVGGAAISEAVFGLYPALTVHFDGDEANGLYIDGRIEKSFDRVVLEKLRLDLAVSLGWSDEGASEWAYGLEDVGFADLRGTASLVYFFDQHLYSALGFGVSTIVDSELRDWFDLIGIDKDNAWVSLGFGYVF